MTDNVSLMTGESMPMTLVCGALEGVAVERSAVCAMGDMVACWGVVALVGRAFTAEAEECLCCVGEVGPLLCCALPAELGGPSLARRGPL